MKYVGTDFEGDMEKMRANPKVREWWAMTDGMQVSILSLFYLIGKSTQANAYPVTGESHSRCRGQCRWTRMVEGPGRGFLQRINGLN
jgi:hypothetical protein